MYCKYKEDQNLRALVDLKLDTEEYVFLPISKEARQKYLKTQINEKKRKK